MARVAAIDCGTNSIRLLIADVSDGVSTEVIRNMTVVRLGEGVDRTGEFAPAALERTLAAVDDYARLCAQHKVEAVRFVATSATRDARNRDAFIAGVRSRLGVEPQVISGEEEAELSFRGATAALGGDHAAPYLVVDLGGGSTELVLGDTAPQAACSIDVGCVRMTERHLSADPPDAAAIAAARADISAALDRAHAKVPLGRTRTLVGLAGTVTTVTAHALRLEHYDRDVLNGAVLPVAEALASCEELLVASVDERLSLGFMHPGRADVIGAGALVWHTVMSRVRDAVAADGGSLDYVVTCEHDILDGMVMALAEAGVVEASVILP